MAFNQDRASGIDKGEEEAKKRSVAYPKTHYMALKDGEHTVLRFITDFANWTDSQGNQHFGWPYVDQHQFMLTRSKPEGYQGNWPQTMGAVCRKDKAFDPAFPDCWLCDNGRNQAGKNPRPQLRYWAVAVEREEVFEDGKLVGYKDKRRKVAVIGKDGKPTGDEAEERAIVIVNQPGKTFFGPLGAFGKVYGTVLDRDYYIKRKGGGLDTDYDIVPLTPIAGYDMRDPEVRSRYNIPDLGKMISDLASDDFYARYFDTRMAQPKAGFSRAGEEGDTPSQPDTTADQAKAAEYASRVAAMGSAAPPSQSAEAAPAAAAPAGPRSFD